MEIIETYRKSPLTIPFENKGKYRDVFIKTSVCREHPIHMHDCTELIYVIRGQVEVKISFELYTVGAGEFLVINCYDLHAVKALQEDTVISCIHLSEHIFSPSEGFIVWCLESLRSSQRKTRELAGEILELIKSYQRNVGERELSACVDNMMRIFRTEFKLEAFDIQKQKNRFDKSEPDLARLNEIYIYFYANYQRKVTLDEMADYFAMNKYYLSHYIKKGSGYNFQQTFTIIRCDRAEIALLESNDTIGNISRRCGFSSNQYFNSSFKNVFGLLPSEYRKKYKDQTLLYKNFLEEEIENPFELWQNETIPRGGTSLLLNLPEGDYKVTIVKESGESSGMETLELRNRNNISMKLDDPESVIIIKKQ